MDLDQIQHLTDEQKERYLQLERTFDTPGWKLVEEYAIQRANDATGRLLAAKSWEENRIFAGGREAFALFANLRESTESEFAALAAANAEAKRTQDEEDYE